MNRITVGLLYISTFVEFRRILHTRKLTGCPARCDVFAEYDISMKTISVPAYTVMYKMVSGQLAKARLHIRYYSRNDIAGAVLPNPHPWAPM
jgi:hypothetical protein